MPGPRKPSATSGDNVLMLLGQLLEATKAASDGLKALNTEVQGNARDIIAASTTLDSLESRISQLDTIVRAAPDGGLVTARTDQAADIRALSENVTRFRDEINVHTAELAATVAKLQAEVAGLVTTTTGVRADMKSSRAMLSAMGKIVAWVATTVVALYAAIKDK